ncbi:MAG: peptidoglycan-binding protein, partial [Treponema sp.]|nr:peptidoglycan-binding protein [Treponema sp.]
MKCRMVMDKIFDSLGEGPLPLWFQLKVGIHLFFCPRCAGELKKLEEARKILQTEFFPPSPDLEDIILSRIGEEVPDGEEKSYETPAGFSFRIWVITGLVVLFSLATSFFGMDFEEIAASEGSSFLLPVGITIGIVLTGYGSLFIGSHLKELS